MTKSLRQKVYEKYNGLCAYTGRPLGEDWQVDHIIPQWMFDNEQQSGDKNHIDNLLPALKEVNHYKRELDLEGFRGSLLTMHHRLSKLPKDPYTNSSIKRKNRLMAIGQLFNICPNTLFQGKFHFEKIESL